ncbi:MAG: ZIP family metal transporter [Alphaproteobacteria bacterium]|nr:ZIP family metal transporter [Alphaproteobacteria bacterium]
MWMEALWLSLGAGLSITLGAFFASFEHIRPLWLEREFRHFVVAFGGGALISAISLVLVPDGIAELSTMSAALSFLAGGIIFMSCDIWLSRKKSNASQLMAMMLDFVPEAIVLGAVISTERSKAILIALIIAAQNFPEGFSAFCEMRNGNKSQRTLLMWFLLIGISGPIYALLGVFIFADMRQTLGILMLFCAGGILYLTFQDIAPQAKLQKHWLPTSGAILGFLVGLVGHMMTQS